MKSDDRPPTSEQLEKQRKALEKTYKGGPARLKGAMCRAGRSTNSPTALCTSAAIAGRGPPRHPASRSPNLADVLAHRPTPDAHESDLATARVGREIQVVDRLGMCGRWASRRPRRPRRPAHPSRPGG